MREGILKGAGEGVVGEKGVDSKLDAFRCMKNVLLESRSFSKTKRICLIFLFLAELPALPCVVFPPFPPLFTCPHFVLSPKCFLSFLATSSALFPPRLPFPQACRLAWCRTSLLLPPLQSISEETEGMQAQC